MYKLLVILFVITDNVNSSQKIPSYDPINLDKNNNILSDGLKSLCSEGPSSVPVPPHYNWLELQENYDFFRKRMKTPFLFSNKESSYAKYKHAPPVKNVSKWRPPKTNSHQLETFLSLVEKDLFTETLKKNVKDCQLIEDERVALIEWRKNNLFNKSSNLVMRLQDKGKRFVVVDKETDRNKAQEQIDKTFVEDVRSRPN